MDTEIKDTEAFKDMVKNIENFEAAIPLKQGASKEDVAYLSKRFIARILEIERMGKTRQESVSIFMKKVQRLAGLYTRWGKGSVMQRLTIQVMMGLMQFAMERPTSVKADQYIKEANVRRGRKNANKE